MSSRRYSRGDRCLVRGLENNSSELNGSLVEILRNPESSSDCYKVKVVHSEKKENAGKVLRTNDLNLVQCELNWTEMETFSNAQGGAKCRTEMGSVAYSETAMYVFGGQQILEPDLDGEDDEAAFTSPDVSDVWSFNYSERKWRRHWWLGLPGPIVGNYQNEPGLPKGINLSRSSPHPVGGAFLVHSEPSSGKELLLFYSSKQHESPSGKTNSATNQEEGEIDALWIFRSSVNMSAYKDLGYWECIPTTGRNPASFLEGDLLNYSKSGRKCAQCTVLVPDKDGDGVRMIFWGGHNWTSFDSQGMSFAETEAAARADIALSGMFELHIPNICLNPSADINTTPALQPRWSLREQKGLDLPMVRHSHSLTRCGRDIVLIGGESIHGMPPQLPEHAGTDVQLGDYAYNLDSCEWRRLRFATDFSKPPYLNNLLAKCGDEKLFMHTECISNHLAFTLPSTLLQMKVLHDHREQLYTAATCCYSSGLLQSGMPNIWHAVWGYLVPPGRGRVLVVRQCDDIYRHANAAEEADNAVMVYDLMEMDVTPLLTFSNVQSGRGLEDGKRRPGAHLFGIGEGLFNAAVYPAIAGSKDGSLLLLLHGKLTDDPSRGRYSMTRSDVSMFTAPVY